MINSLVKKNIEDFELLLDSTQIYFDFIGITETRILKSKFPVTDSNLTNHSYEYCPTAGVTMLYIGNHLSYKARNDLCIYKTAELKSTFIELINIKKVNVIISAIYRHPNMDLDEFHDIYLNHLLDKIPKESKSIFLLGDFNVDHAAANKFLDCLSPHMFLPHVIQPTRITSNSKTLIDNIFSNIFGPDSVSGNLTATVSDHLPQFVIAFNISLTHL